jgi:hypothetical protein
LIAAYLVAIVLANFAVTYFGVAASITTAFFLIGLDITARDALHERWYRRGLVWKMGVLIAAGSLISYVLNAKTSRVAIASFVSFAVANLADALVYQKLHRRPRLFKIARTSSPRRWTASSSRRSPSAHSCRSSSRSSSPRRRAGDSCGRSF